MSCPVVTYTALGPYLADAGIPAEAETALLRATKGRACLFLEINDFTLRNHFGLDNDVIKKLTKARFAASHVVKKEEIEPHPGKYFAWGYTDRKWDYYGVFTENVIECRPRHVQWIQYVACGNPMSACAVANAVEGVFRETEHVTFGREKGLDFHTFKERCDAVGMVDIVSNIILDETGEEKPFARIDTGRKPRDNIDKMREGLALPKNTAVPWTFVGLLKEEARFRLMVATVAKSWRSNVSAWRAWGAFMDAVAPFDRHFPATEGSLASYAGLFDNAFSLSKYIQHLRKAHLLLSVDFVPVDALRCLVTASAKFCARYNKSFMTWEPSSMIVEELLDRGEVQLARCVSVAYQYQLRVQSELLPLQAVTMTQVPEGDKWHSFVREKSVGDDGRPCVEIVLRIRKNKDVPTSVVRKCQCADTQWLCGVCALLAQVRSARNEGQDLVFPAVKSSDINVIKNVSRDLAMDMRVTWHGFRRGRTSDLLTCNWQDKVSVKDVFQSGGWVFGSRSVFKYLTEDAVDPHKIAVNVAAKSDSEPDA